MSNETQPASGVAAVVHLPARDVPMPASISPEARGYLTMMAGATSPLSVPSSGGDTSPAALRERIIATDRAIAAMSAPGAAAARASVETQTLGGVTVYVAAREEATSAERSKVHIHVHGGAFIYGGGELTKQSAQVAARAYGGLVVAVDYRMPPDHPFPAAPEDCLAVYRALLEQHAPSKIFVSGGSAGGNIAAALMHKARDAGLPPPAALFLNTPVTDFAVPGDSRAVNALVDVVLKSGASESGLYVADADRNNPYLSPLRGDLSRGFPPTYLRSGTRDLLLSDTVRMHAALRKAGVDADLYVGEGMPHGGFGGNAPEQNDAEADLVRWLARHWR